LGKKVPVDYFASSVWDEARRKAVRASVYMRQHGPFMPSILGPEEMEYTTRPAVLSKLKDRMEKID
jgi:fructose 1,6-bisphosphate aldolase/phosphatase